MTYMNTRTLTLRISEELMTELEEDAARRNVAVSVVARQRLTVAVTATGISVPSEVYEKVVVGQIPDDTKVRTGANTACPHPKARLRQTVKGKRCLDCGKDV
jgi:hypothetical protein